MNILEHQMMLHPWETLSVGVFLGILAGIFIAYWGNRWINHDVRLEVRTRGEDAIYADDVRGEEA